MNFFFFQTRADQAQRTSLFWSRQTKIGAKKLAFPWWLLLPRPVGYPKTNILQAPIDDMGHPTWGAESVQGARRLGSTATESIRTFKN